MVTIDFKLADVKLGALRLILLKLGKNLLWDFEGFLYLQENK